MLKLPQVTLVCVDTKNHTSARNAMAKSMENIEFGYAFFFTNYFSCLKQRFIEIQIDKINSKEEYSHFILNRLNDYILTEFCLVIQFDGYVINPGLWSKEFLEFDYIGAPWWYTDGRNVGNGGFSLRSKKLLEACQLENFENYHIEDNTICRDYRELLEKKYGIKYAPEQIAEKFSYEPNMAHPEFKNNSFGFHGIPKLIL